MAKRRLRIWKERTPAQGLLDRLLPACGWACITLGFFVLFFGLAWLAYRWGAR